MKALFLRCMNSCWFLSLLVLSGCAAAPLSAQQIPEPEDVIGFDPGENYKLADNEQLEAYYRELADASDRIELEVIGETHRGRDLLMLVVSSEENLERLDHYRQISERLAKADDLDDNEARELAREGKSIVWIDSGLHSAEFAHAQHSPHLAYYMATDESEESHRIRDDVIMLLMPVMNPDGQEVVVDWYRSQRDTPFEETGPPWLWHEYVDHDNNRDWYMLLQDESRAVAEQIYNTWYPQIVLNHHQMGEMPPRMFIPPFADPVNPNIPEKVVRGTNLVGEHMANRFAGEGKSGIIQRITFNMWWNGGMRTAPYFHNMVGILTESTHRSPVPRYWEEEDIPESITRGGKEIPMKEPSVFYPDPWEGGESSIGQMVDYHLTASMGVLDIASLRREEWLYNIYQMGRDQIQKGRDSDTFAYVVSPEQWDGPEAIEMLRVLDRGGLEIHRANSDFTADGETYPAGSYILYTDQAFRSHLIDMLEPQEYPDRRLYPGGPPEPPYDMAGWTLPIQMGVHVDRISSDFDAQVESVEDIPAWSAAVDGSGDDSFLLAPRSNFATKAVSRLIEDGHTISRAADTFSEAGNDFDAGTFIIESNGAGTRDKIASLSSELGLDFTATAGTPNVDQYEMEMPRIAKYQSWVKSIDGGWTRWIFDNYEVSYDTLNNHQIQEGELLDYDVLVMPAATPGRIMQGHEAGTMPEEFTGGLGVEGALAIKEFVKEGGTVVSWDGTTDFLIEQLSLPVRNRLSGVTRDDFFIPGSLVQLKVDNTNPFGFGMQEEAGAWFVDRRGSQSRSFRIVEPASSQDQKADPPAVEPIAWYPEEDILQSGWALGEDRYLAGNPAVVRAELGEGDVILIGVRPQFRAQPRATFNFIFNALWNSATHDLPAVEPYAAE